MAYENIIVTTEGAVGLVTLNRPKALNALNSALLNELVTAFEAFDNDDAIGAIVITGSERAFAAGADITEMAPQSYMDMFKSNFFASAADKLAATRKPVIAAVAGYALGGGCELAMLADFVIAGDSAKFGLPELKLGLIPGLGGTQRLVRAVGKPLAMKLILTAEFIDAPTALAAGLVAEVVPAAQTISRALELAGKVAGMAPLAAWAAKEAINQAFETTLSSGLLFERKSTVQLYPSEDKQEGIKAFLEKRPPVFKGK